MNYTAKCATMSTVHNELLEEVDRLLSGLTDEQVKDLVKWAKEEFCVENLGE